MAALTEAPDGSWCSSGQAQCRSAVTSSSTRSYRPDERGSPFGFVCRWRRKGVPVRIVPFGAVQRWRPAARIRVPIATPRQTGDAPRTAAPSGMGCEAILVNSTMTNGAITTAKMSQRLSQAATRSRPPLGIRTG